MKRVKNDLTGQRFGRLVVIGIDDKDTRKTYYYCKCDCGNVKSIRADSLVSGAIRSCGCLKKEQDKVNLTTNHKHKMSHTRMYDVWQGMKQRCYNPKDARYASYGGRGIKVCDDWVHDFSTFYEWSMENGYNDSLTIDRINNDDGYSPSNCRWASNKIQSRNRRSNVKITIGNSTRCLTEWCEIFDLNPITIMARYSRNGFISIDELFNR